MKYAGAGISELDAIYPQCFPYMHLVAAVRHCNFFLYNNNYNVALPLWKTPILIILPFVPVHQSGHSKKVFQYSHQRTNYYEAMSWNYKHYASVDITT